jgi:hypothetical protein
MTLDHFDESSTSEGDARFAEAQTHTMGLPVGAVPPLQGTGANRTKSNRRSMQGKTGSQSRGVRSSTYRGLRGARPIDRRSDGSRQADSPRQRYTGSFGASEALGLEIVAMRSAAKFIQTGPGTTQMEEVRER